MKESEKILRDGITNHLRQYSGMSAEQQIFLRLLAYLCELVFPGSIVKIPYKLYKRPSSALLGRLLQSRTGVARAFTKMCADPNREQYRMSVQLDRGEVSYCFNEVRLSATIPPDYGYRRTRKKAVLFVHDLRVSLHGEVQVIGSSISYGMELGGRQPYLVITVDSL